MQAAFQVYILPCVCVLMYVCVRVCMCAETKVLLEHTLKTQACDIINPDDMDTKGDTALHVVVKSPPFTELHSDITVLLIESGALPNVRDRAGKMPHEHVPNNFSNAIIYEKLTAALQRPGWYFHHILMPVTSNC